MLTIGVVHEALKAKQKLRIWAGQATTKWVGPIYSSICIGMGQDSTQG